MDAEQSPEEDGPLFAYVHPDDRLWRHPSEMAAAAPSGPERGPVVVASAPAGAGVRTPLFGRTWAVAALAGSVGALVASGVWVVSGHLEPRTTVVAAVTQAMAPTSLASASMSPGSGPGWAPIVDAVAPSVASVTAWGTDGPIDGSAVVYGTNAAGSLTYLLTDAGLVDQARTVEVTFNGGVAVPGRVVRSDATSQVALLTVSGGGHPAAAFGSVGDLDVADAVMALGGRSSGTAAAVAGSVATLDRTVTDVSTSATVCGLLALTTTLPSGDDGGAVVDDDGTVVGVSTGLVSQDPDDTGTSFAVPIDVAMHVAQQMIDRQRVTNPWVGIDATSDLDSATAQAMGVTGGAEVLGVDAGSPAAAAGLRPDDVVTALDGRPVTSSGSLLAQMTSMPIGRIAALTYHRGSAVATVGTRVVEQPSSPSS